MQRRLRCCSYFPVVKIWLRYAGDKIPRLGIDSSGGSFQDGSAWGLEASSPGDSARNAGIDSVGFSTKRFLFWKKRLWEITEGDYEEVQKHALDAFNVMNGIWNAFSWEKLVTSYVPRQECFRGLYILHSKERFDEGQ